MGDEPDPRQLAAHQPPMVAEYASSLPTPAFGQVVELAQPMAAPMAETQRTASPAPRTQQLIIGENAQPSIDEEFRRALTGSQPDWLNEYHACTDREVIEMLLLGRADFGVIGGSLSARETQAGMRQTALGVELFALSVSPQSAVRSLTRTQVRQIFTREVTDWQQLGFGAGAIVPIVPSDLALARRAEQTLIRGDSFASNCIRAPGERDVADQILQIKGAIGVVRVTAGQRESGQRLLQIDWSPPTPEAYSYGTYPYGIPLQLITSGQPDEQARRVLAFAQSEAARALLGRTLTFVR